MRKFLIISAAASALMLGACSEEPEVGEGDELGYDEASQMGNDEVDVVEPVGLATWDTNNDGVFQEAEYTTWDQNGITAWDTDADSRLSSEEFTTGWTSAGFTNADGVFSSWDDDSDGYLTNDEFFDDEEWTEWDTNSNGILETTEFGYY